MTRIIFKFRIVQNIVYIFGTRDFLGKDIGTSFRTACARRISCHPDLIRRRSIVFPSKYSFDVKLYKKNGSQIICLNPLKGHSFIFIFRANTRLKTL